ncbi:MAG TPA: SCP2 domain-containing protein [Arsenophonus nasoniae]|uniref:ubiquinone anaerobic biosynthesis accessory factor UbiT n=1 Tax=Arsenophonus nasoniae TaxID=638 RepID=UPI0038793047
MLKKIRQQIIQQGPKLMRLPLKVTPFIIERQILEQLLSWQFQQALNDGELDFLHNKWLKVEVLDVQLVWYISLQAGKIIVSQDQQADVSFCSGANDLVLIAARKEDPDTLFFQRRLHIEGDTELGLYVKNLLGAFELETMPAILRFGLLQFADLIKLVQNENIDYKERALSC